MLARRGAAARRGGPHGRRPAGPRTAARSAARSRTPTRPPTCRPRCWPWAARVVLRSPRGERVGADHRVLHRLFSTVKEPDELITEIRVPRTGSAGWAYEKFTRRANDWAIVGGRRGRRPGRAGQHGRRPRCGPPPPRRRWPGAPRSPTPPRWPPRAPIRRRTSPPPGSTAATWPGCSPAAPSPPPRGLTRRAASATRSGRISRPPERVRAGPALAGSDFPADRCMILIGRGNEVCVTSSRPSGSVPISRRSRAATSSGR